MPSDAGRTPPPQQMPPAAAGSPAIIGDAPWRASRTPYCARGLGVPESLSIWSEPEAVYVLASGADGETIQRNDGNGWREIYRQALGSSQVDITGFAGGPLLRYGAFACAIQVVDAGRASCSAAVLQISDVIMLGHDHGYAVYDDRVLELDGEHWVQWGEPLEPRGAAHARAVWSDGATTAIAGNDGLFYVAHGGTQPQPESDAPTGTYMSLWGNAKRLWAGQRDGSLAYFDGDSWSTPWRSQSECQRGVLGLWGSNDTVYLITDSELAVMENGAVHVLHSFSCESGNRFAALWGNSADEVFVAVRHEPGDGAACGAATVLWYDGQALARF